jgi:phospholipase C
MYRFVGNDNVVPNYLSHKKFSNPSKLPNFNNPCFNPSQVMGYYDGNTVTALWNYAQHFAMSDNFYQTNFGESIPGHLNLILVRHMEQFQLLIQRDILLMGQ